MRKNCACDCTYQKGSFLKALVTVDLRVFQSQLNQQVTQKARPQRQNMVRKTKGNPFVMSAILRPKTAIFALITLVLLWLSYDAIIEISKLLERLWAWRPVSVYGLIMIVAPLLLAFPAHYFLNIKRTNHHGIIEVKSFSDYISHGFINFLVRIAFMGSFLGGVFLFLFG